MSEENNLTATEYCELLKTNDMLLQLNQDILKENQKLKENNKSIMEELLRVVGLYNQQKSVLDEIREQTKSGITSYNYGGSRTSLFEVLVAINEILDKVKE